MTHDGDRADLVVVGAGVAGLTAAIHAAELGLTVIVTTKGSRRTPGADTSTRYAQGGIAVVDPTDPADSIDVHLTDTLSAGAGHTDPLAARSILADGPDAVAALIAWGARFDAHADGMLRRTREGGHGVRRIIHAGGDATGAEVERALWEALRPHMVSGRVGVRAETMVIAVDTDLDGRAIGVTARDGTGRAVALRAPTVLLATGGIGQIYAATTNPEGSMGDGVALALRAGAAVADLEFVQFHPTMLHTPGARGRRTLISEAVRGEGARLVDADGVSITEGVHPLGDLAPRDVVAHAVHTAMVASGRDCMFLDARDVPDVAQRFPTVTAGVRAIGLDPAVDPIPVVPGAHYLCGGVATGDRGDTTVEGLFAAGEVARTGLHGANRLASNSLLEGLVMGRRVARAAADRAGTPITPTDVEMLTRAARCDRTTLQDAMSAGAGVTRDAAGLTAVADLVAAAKVRPLRSFSDVADAAATMVAGAVVAAALRRDESRGCHRRADRPLTDPVSRLEWARIDEPVGMRWDAADPVGSPVVA
ncbi:L-aspartate oxidase [Williamsia sp. MIQD14]|uniref:L-aspartate oxidase n=1 Tax=Williamsia sp. MIQD14 TaxID=3425703 RepID=UPI003DA07F3E